MYFGVLLSVSEGGTKRLGRDNSSRREEHNSQQGGILGITEYKLE